MSWNKTIIKLKKEQDLDWLFMFVLPVARENEPRVKYDAISSFVRTSASVTPASVIPPFTVSLICMGTLAGPEAFMGAAPSFLEKVVEFGSSKSNTSSLNIYQCRKANMSTYANNRKEKKKVNYYLPQ